MTFLIVSAVFFMLSASVAEYVDNSNGHVVFEATLMVDTAQFRQRDTSPTKHLIPDEIAIDFKCRDKSNDSELNVDAVEWTPTDDWYMATGMADDTTTLLMETHVVEQAFASCYTIIKMERYHKRTLENERRT